MDSITDMLGFLYKDIYLKHVVIQLWLWFIFIAPNQLQWFSAYSRRLELLVQQLASESLTRTIQALSYKALGFFLSLPWNLHSQ